MSWLDIVDHELLKLCQYVVHLESGSNLIVADLISSDPYCEISVQGLTQTSAVIPKQLNPVWNQTFCFYTESPHNVFFKVWDFDSLGKNDPMGEAEFESKEYFDMLDSHRPEGVAFEGELALRGVKHGLLKVKIRCRTMTPIKTERLLEECESQLGEMRGKLAEDVKRGEERKRTLERGRGEIGAKDRRIDQLMREIEELKAGGIQIGKPLEKKKHCCWMG
jgi:hypothetical protein